MPRRVQKRPMDEQVLRLLRKNPSGFVSGQEISRHLEVTRTAVWKRVKSLRHLGYEIEAFRRLGYRLVRSPDLLTPWEILPILKTKWMGKKIRYFRTIDSTNSEAYQLALRGAKEGEIVLAESQERGRGRVGRQWFSPSSLNLYLSVILRPNLPPHRASLLTLMAAVATADAIETFAGLHPTIKWPNDILLNGRKIAGLLNEIHSETDRIHFVVLGIGVNLNVDRQRFPQGIRDGATSLKEEMGQKISRKAFLAILLESLEKWYGVFPKDGGASVLNAWRDRAQIAGKQVRISSFDEVLVGRAVDVDSEGALLVQMRNGQRKRIVAGDVDYTGTKAAGGTPGAKRQIPSNK
ncbi:MAG: biotin--[acetyl-CoA-carboxylase] ligase [Desulfobacterales bacterium]|nr:biotin--[acetyl-CoA-carboxylase] ligase [Desulfobacterales bacterium]